MVSPLGHAQHAWIFEDVGALAFVAFLVYHAWKTAHTRQLSIAALAFVGCLSMAWQEFYGDWGCYLLYNRDFAHLPWGHTTWTAPVKPWAVLAGYGWFYSVLFPVMLWLLARLRSARPNWQRFLAAGVVAGPALYLWNFASADGLAARFRWWAYVDTIGPTVRQGRIDVPLLYPIGLFAVFGVVALWLIDTRDDRGRPRFERLLRSRNPRPGASEQVRRAATWVIAMNVTYFVTLIGPLVALRLAFGGPSTLVP